jgi:peptidoglycan-associated lipoprotein
MNRLSRLAPVILLGAIALTTTACPKRPETTPTPTVNEDSLARERARQDSIAAAERRRADSIAALGRARQDSIAAAERARMEAVNAARSAITNAIYFDYDQSELTEQSRSTLDAKVPVLNANPNVRLVIAGHTDSRGSDEYNLALGQRRAAAAKRYLVQRGIAGDRIEVRSFGEERPVASGEDESSWSQNRRDEFEITAGGDNIVPAQQ